MIQYRFLREDEWSKLDAVFAERNQAPPSPSTALVSIAEDTETGQVVGFLVFQLQLHAEPLWIDPNYRGKVAIRGLLRQGETAFSRDVGRAYYVFSDGENISKLCERLGLKQTGYEVYKKEL